MHAYAPKLSCNLLKAYEIKQPGRSAGLFFGWNRAGNRTFVFAESDVCNADLAARYGSSETGTPDEARSKDSSRTAAAIPKSGHSERISDYVGRCIRTQLKIPQSVQSPKRRRDYQCRSLSRVQTEPRALLLPDREAGPRIRWPVPQRQTGSDQAPPRR